MNFSKLQNMTAKILEDWYITDVRYAFPVQLRPPRGTTIPPMLIAALSDLSKISKGQVERVRNPLRDAVRKRYSRSMLVGQTAVTMADVLKARDWMLAQMEEIEREQSPPETGNDTITTGGDQPTTPS